WGPQAIGDHGAPVTLPKLKKAYEKGTRGISWSPLLTPGPRAMPEFPNGLSAPDTELQKKVHALLFKNTTHQITWYCSIMRSGADKHTAIVICV
ncbi:unnamed protein product, partial [Staurois parvus]